VDQRVLQDLLSEKLPRLTAHLGQHRVDLSLITFNWFLVVFADSLISDILLRVWDAFLYEGTKVSVPGPTERKDGHLPEPSVILNCKVLCAI
jgi:hypothetical protein